MAQAAEPQGVMAVLLQPHIEAKVRANFAKGDFDVAVFQAFKAVEVAVRLACGYQDGELGVKLVAFLLRHFEVVDFFSAQDLVDYQRWFPSGGFEKLTWPSCFRTTLRMIPNAPRPERISRKFEGTSG